MIPWSKYLINLFLVVSPLFCYSQSSDIFNYENSLDYAEYLIESHQYSAALNELDRMIEAYPERDTLKEMYIKICYTDKRYQEGESKVEQWFINEHKIVPYPVMVRYNYLLLEQDDFAKFKAYTDTTTFFKQEVQQHLRFNSALLLENWQQADVLLKGNEENEFTSINLGLLNEGRSIRYKSTFKGALYAALIPGMGKIYAKDTKDGVYSFFSVAIPAISAVRGFNKRGVESVYGWANLGLASFMYTGNIYGAVRSVRQYNKTKKEAYRAKVKGNIYRIY